MAAKATTRTGAARRSAKRRTIAVEEEPSRLGMAEQERDFDDWMEEDPDEERLDETQVEMLLTGHAATHGNDAEDNWLIDSDELHRGER